MAANDLGVLLAERGRYEDARTLLSHGLSVAPHAAIWQNLAIVHTKLGQPEAAARAQMAASAAGGATAANPAFVAMQSLRWVPPSEFASSTQPATDLQRPATNIAAGATTNSPVPSGGKATGAPREARQRPWSNWFN
jgi:hypothetical protein